MTSTNDKIHAPSGRFDLDRHLAYLLGYAEHAGSVVVTHDLMNEIVTAFSYYRGKATHLQAREERREQRDKRRKDT